MCLYYLRASILFIPKEVKHSSLYSETLDTVKSMAKSVRPAFHPTSQLVSMRTQPKTYNHEPVLSVTQGAGVLETNKPIDDPDTRRKEMSTL